MRVTGLNNSFAAGEIAPDAWERSDLAQHQTGCEEAFNFLGLTTGPNASRGGFWRRGAPKHHDRARRVFTWLRSDGEGLILELGDLHGRVWTARGAPIETSPGSGVPYEFAHGYSAADLRGLRLHQVGDVAFVTSREGLLNSVIKRISDTDWTWESLPLIEGPFLAENRDEAKTLTLTYVGGDEWSVVASFDLFEAGHVSGLFRLRPPGGTPGLKTWAPDTAFSGGEQVISGGRVYQKTGGASNSGNTPPSHARGAVSDGAITWQFLHDGATTIQITAVTDPMNATAVAQSGIPFPDGTATSNWAEGAFSSARGHPTALAAVREERLVLAGAAAQPDVMHLTRTAGFTPDLADFKPGLGTGLVVDDDAVTVRVGDRGNRIVWALDGLVLVVGTTHHEWVVSGGSIEEPITPSTVKARRLSSWGSADVAPVALQGPPVRIMHVGRGADTLREITMDGDGRVGGRELSILGGHVFGKGMVELAWSHPDNTLWIQLTDGTLAAFTYHHEHEVMGVRRQPLPGGWLAESIATSPGPDGKDRLTVAAVRTKGGVAQRAHFVLALRDEGMFLDCAQDRSGAPVEAIGGLSHLEGETVAVFADGAYVGERLVQLGVVALDAPASHIRVGLKMQRRFKSLPADWDRSGGQPARKTRPTEAWVIYGGVEATVYATGEDDPQGLEPPKDTVSTRRPGDTLPVTRRGRFKVGLGGGADRDVRIVVETDEPFDLVVYALRPAGDAQ